MSVDERLKGLFDLIDDRFMTHEFRAQATRLIPDARVKKLDAVMARFGVARP